MLLFGHRFIDSERFYHIDDIDAIAHTPPGSLLYLAFSKANLDIIAHLNANALRFGLEAQTLRDVIYANALGASYIIVEEDLANNAQKVAENYLFDAKILCRIDEEEKIEAMAHEGIDGILFPEAIIKISS